MNNSLLILCFSFLSLYIVFAVGGVNAFKFFPTNQEVTYEYAGNVKVEPQPPWVDSDAPPPVPSGWRVRGTLKVQRIDHNSLAAAVSLHFSYL